MTEVRAFVAGYAVPITPVLTLINIAACIAPLVAESGWLSAQADPDSAVMLNRQERTWRQPPSNDAIFDAEEIDMRTTVAIDDGLFEKAQQYAALSEQSLAVAALMPETLVWTRDRRLLAAAQRLALAAEVPR